MYKKNLNFKSVVFKVFFFYLIVYFLALIFRYTYDIEDLLINIGQPKGAKASGH